MLRNEHVSQFSTNQSIVAEFGRALCLQATKRLSCRKVCFKWLTKFQDRVLSWIYSLGEKSQVAEADKLSRGVRGHAPSKNVLK